MKHNEKRPLPKQNLTKEERVKCVKLALESIKMKTEKDKHLAKAYKNTTYFDNFTRTK